MRDKTQHFWNRVEKTDTCWLWKGYAPRYGALTFNGRRVSAHRLAFELTNGAIPHDKVVMHTCDNPLCVNPNHLRLGSQEDNIRDMINKGRNVKPKGSSHHRTKLSKKDVEDILNSKEDTTLLMNRYELSRSTVCRIRGGYSSCANNLLQGK